MDRVDRKLDQLESLARSNERTKTLTQVRKLLNKKTRLALEEARLKDAELYLELAGDLDELSKENSNVTD